MLVGVGGEHQPPLAIEHPDAVYTLFVGDDPHDFVGRFAVIVEHGMPGGTGNTARKLIRAQDHCFHKVLFLGTKIEIAADAADRHDQDGERKNQFRAKFSRHGWTLSSFLA